MLLVAVSLASPCSAANRRERRHNLSSCNGGELTWRVQNNDFWSELGEASFQEIAVRKGMSEHIDYRQPEIQRLLGISGGSIPRSALVIGAGFGRDLDYLRAESSIPYIFALDVGPLQVMRLREKYDSSSSAAGARHALGMSQQVVEIREGNITDTHVYERGKTQFQLALWMFSGFLELSPTEKRHAVRNLHNLMAKGGAVAVDVQLGRVTSDLEIEGLEETIRLHNPNGNTRLNLHPINHATGEVDIAKVRSYFESEGRFRLYREAQYRSDAPANQPRLLMFFLKLER